MQRDLRIAEHRLRGQPTCCFPFLPKADGANIAPSTNVLLGWPFLRIEYAILTVTRYTPNVSISGSGPAPGKGGKAAEAENEKFERESVLQM